VAWPTAGSPSRILLTSITIPNCVADAVGRPSSYPHDQSRSRGNVPAFFACHGHSRILECRSPRLSSLYRITSPSRSIAYFCLSPRPPDPRAAQFVIEPPYSAARTMTATARNCSLSPDEPGGEVTRCNRTRDRQSPRTLTPTQRRLRSHLLSLTNWKPEGGIFTDSALGSARCGRERDECRSGRTARRGDAAL
jgi:hypothetical protein